MKKNNVLTMGDYFSVDYIRKNLIKVLKDKNFSNKEIDKLIKICDEAYKEYRIPYPTVEELLGEKVKQ